MFHLLGMMGFPFRTPRNGDDEPDFPRDIYHNDKDAGGENEKGLNLDVTRVDKGHSCKYRVARNDYE